MLIGIEKGGSHRQDVQVKEEEAQETREEEPAANGGRPQARGQGGRGKGQLLTYNVHQNKRSEKGWTYRVFIKYCIFFPKILIYVYSGLCFLSMSVSVHNGRSNTRKPSENHNI